MEPEKKYEIALQLYRAMLREDGIRFFPQQVDKKVKRIERLLEGVSQGHLGWDIQCFLYAEYNWLMEDVLEQLPRPDYEYRNKKFPAGKIALAFLLDEGREHGVKLDLEDLKKKIGNAYKLTKIPKAELTEFYREVLCEFFQSLKV